MTLENPMANNEAPPVANERRRHARVQDAVVLHLQRLHDMPAAGESEPDQPTARKVRRQNKYDIDGYASVRRDFPDVAEYIQELEERIRQLLLDGDRVEQQPSHKVSLSASGLAFADDVLLHPGELVGVTLTLFPDLKRIACDARVVSAGDAPEIANGDKPTYRVAFLRMTDQDRDTLNTHVQSLIKSLPTHND